MLAANTRRLDSAEEPTPPLDRQSQAVPTLRPMETNELPDHLARPHIRRFIPIGIKPKDAERPVVLLQDPLRLSDRTINISPEALALLQRFQGEKTLEEIAESVGAKSDQLIPLVKALDEIGLLWGPTSSAMEQDLCARIDGEGRLPKGAAFSLGTDAAECRKQLAEWLEETEDPEVGDGVVGIVAPHLDYGRGWPVYAAAYRAVAALPRPDRIVVLGTNHFGIGDGVVMTRWGFESPLGAVEPDREIQAKLAEALGERALADQLDHVGEHSIQLHLPWIQHLFPEVPVVAALVPDPLQGLIEDDGKRVGTEEFLAALGSALEEAGGRTFFIASSDLSHAGPQFGEPRAVDEERRGQVEKHDREMLRRFIDATPSEFLETVEWNRNPTRWCSVGNMAATKRLANPGSVELLDYRQAVDEQGVALVSCAALALLK